MTQSVSDLLQLFVLPIKPREMLCVPMIDDLVGVLNGFAEFSSRDRVEKPFHERSYSDGQPYEG